MTRQRRERGIRSISPSNRSRPKGVKVAARIHQEWTDRKDTELELLGFQPHPARALSQPPDRCAAAPAKTQT
ncbi:MAG: hypothetical protein OXH83_00255 [Bryobacterales bacterium]|nr:hypothetical protein [Bryobacterales bacterium]